MDTNQTYIQQYTFHVHLLLRKISTQIQCIYYLGLLGTNNNEQYDEFLKPDKAIAKSIVEFANAWEVSGDPECKVTVTERKVRTHFQQNTLLNENDDNCI